MPNLPGDVNWDGFAMLGVGVICAGSEVFKFSLWVWGLFRWFLLVTTLLVLGPCGFEWVVYWDYWLVVGWYWDFVAVVWCSIVVLLVVPFCNCAFV